MTEQENFNVETQSRVSNLETKFETFMQSFDDFKQEMRDFKTEMRNRDNQRATEIMEIRQRQEAAQAKHNADMIDLQKNFYDKMDTMDTKIDGIGKHVQNLTVAAMVGIGAAVIGIGAIAVTVVYSVFTR